MDDGQKMFRKQWGEKRKNAMTAQNVQMQQHIYCLFICARFNLQPHFKFNNLPELNNVSVRILNLYRLSNYKNIFVQEPRKYCNIFAINEPT